METQKSSEAVLVEDSALCPPKDIAGLRKLATDALNQHQKAVKAYWALCVYIRTKQITPDIVTQELRDRGFADSRISEIKRVAFCAPALFEDFRKGVVGFRFVLGQERAQKLLPPPEQTEMPTILKGEDKLKAEMIDALSAIIPLKGPLPLLLRYQFPVVVNGYSVTIRVKKIKAQKPAGKAKK